MRIAITKEFLSSDRFFHKSSAFAAIAKDRGFEWEFIDPGEPEIRPELLVDFDVLILLGNRITARSLESSNSLALIARWGVGYDNVDINACSAQGIGVTITPNGCYKSVAYATLTMILALASKLQQKSRLIGNNGWTDRSSYVGDRITGQVLGSVGLGRNARELFRLTKPFGFRQIAFDPFVNAEAAEALGVEAVSLETLLKESDFLAVNCPLTPETEYILDANALASMKSTAYIVNVSRGRIIDDMALAEAIAQNRIAGAGLDGFTAEPLPADHPLLKLESVIVTPRCLAWTEELYEGNNNGVIDAIKSFAQGEIPAALLNREVIENPVFKAKIAAMRK